MPVAFFDLFNTDDHIDRVYKELKEVCFILIIMYLFSHSLCLCNLGFEWLDAHSSKWPSTFQPLCCPL